MNSLILQIDEEIERRSLLKHPFYEMWSQGKLTRDHLSGYSLEYFQLVKAVPEMVKSIQEKSSRAVNGKLNENLREESEHIGLWTRFASSLGISNDELVAYSGLRGTNLAVSQMKNLSKTSFEAGIAAMYAYERDLPKISSTKIRGLKEFYGLESSDALEYFLEHEIVDVRHAAIWRSMLENIAAANHEISLEAAITSLESQNKLLDSVMEKYVS
ncbi:MAG: iron-containing redox enzyme family protein [Thaumarchaeota archaeon]|nr:iron-containing redox enzyme family protein [Nitrososphaerota archaeon]